MKVTNRLLAAALCASLFTCSASMVMADETAYPVTYSQTLDGNDYDFEIAQAPEKAVSMSQATT